MWSRWSFLREFFEVMESLIVIVRFSQYNIYPCRDPRHISYKGCPIVDSCLAAPYTAWWCRCEIGFKYRHSSGRHYALLRLVLFCVHSKPSQSYTGISMNRIGHSSWWRSSLLYLHIKHHSLNTADLDEFFALILNEICSWFPPSLEKLI